jgi:hypothetical protein
MLSASDDESLLFGVAYDGEVCSLNGPLLLLMGKNCSDSSPSANYFLFMWILGRNGKRAKKKPSLPKQSLGLGTVLGREVPNTIIGSIEQADLGG